jgi:hypothetical protein
VLKKNIKFLIAIYFFLFPIYNAVHAAPLENIVSSDPFKTWTIKFNEKINFDKITQNSISVLDSKGNLIPVTLSLGNDSKSIIISPPSAGYNIDESYKLKITSDLHSIGNKHFNEEKNINFSIKKYLTDNEIKDVLKNIEDNTIKMCYSRKNDEILNLDGKTYLAFTDEFNSEEKVYKFLRNYYTDEMSKVMMDYLGTRYVNDSYAEICGDWGENTDWQSITIINKHYLDSNTLQFTCDYFNENNYSTDNKSNPKHYYSTYKLKYEDGRWLVTYNSNFK